MTGWPKYTSMKILIASDLIGYDISLYGPNIQSLWLHSNTILGHHIIYICNYHSKYGGYLWGWDDLWIPREYPMLPGSRWDNEICRRHNIPRQAWATSHLPNASKDFHQSNPAKVVSSKLCTMSQWQRSSWWETWISENLFMPAAEPSWKFHKEVSWHYYK